MKRRLTALGVILALGVAALVFRPAGESRPDKPREAPAKSVAVAPVETAELVERLQEVGTIRAREAVTIAAETAGTVRQVLFEDGQQVTKGTPLVELDAAEEKARVEATRATLDTARRAFDRAQELRAKGNVAPAALDNAAAALEEARAQHAMAQARLAERTIAAPFSGRLGFRQVSPGAYVEPGDAITTLDDVRTVYVDFPVPETRLAALAPGQPVTLGSAAHPGRGFPARVVSIGSRIDPQSRQAQVRALADNPQMALRPGQLVAVDVGVARRRAILVPGIALVSSGYQHFAFVIGESGTVERRGVQLGLRQDDSVEILAGLAKGDRLVIEGAAKLDQGDAVRIVPVAGLGR